MCVLQDIQKQLQFIQSERTKVQSAYDVLKKQWEEHSVNCNQGNKVQNSLQIEGLDTSYHNHFEGTEGTKFQRFYKIYV